MKKFILSIVLVLFIVVVNAQTKYFRLSYNDDPSTTISIGWSGADGTVYYGLEDEGTDYTAYPNSQAVDRLENHRGMDNRFVNLKGLSPNTVYYFVVRDEAGNLSDRYSFQTISDNPDQPLSFINGGDTRLAGPIVEGPCDCRNDRIRGNKLVAKLRPDFIVFNGDFVLNSIGSQTNNEWDQWFEDWEYTTAEDGRLFPLMIATGNHEDDLANLTFGDPNFRDVYRLFNIPVKDVYYALNFGGNLIRMYALNSELHACWDKDQLNWLEEDMRNYSTASNSPYWKMVNYHQPMVPNSHYDRRNDMYNCWAPLFDQYHARLVMESHSHTMKTTYPIKLDSTAPYDFENAGFSRNDECGTVYIGEGNWAAPQRGEMEFRPRAWTRQLAEIRSYFYIQVTKSEIKIYSPTFSTDEMVNNTATATDNELGSDLPAGVTLFDEFFYDNTTNVEYIIPNSNENCLDFVQDPTVGLFDNVVKKAKIYPNPVNDKLYIQLDQSMRDAKISVFDALGKECKGISLKQVSGNKYVIDASSLCSKVGYVMIKSNGDTETHKYLKP